MFLRPLFEYIRDGTALKFIDSNDQCLERVQMVIEGILDRLRRASDGSDVSLLQAFGPDLKELYYTQEFREQIPVHAGDVGYMVEGHPGHDLIFHKLCNVSNNFPVISQRGSGPLIRTPEMADGSQILI